MLNFLAKLQKFAAQDKNVYFFSVLRQAITFVLLLVFVLSLKFVIYSWIFIVNGIGQKGKKNILVGYIFFAFICTVIFAKKTQFEAIRWERSYNSRKPINIQRIPHIYHLCIISKYHQIFIWLIWSSLSSIGSSSTIILFKIWYSM